MITPAVWAGAAATAAVAGTWAARRRHQWRVNQAQPRQYQPLVDGLRHTPWTPKVILNQPDKRESNLRQQGHQQWTQVQQFIERRARHDGRQVAFEGAQAWFKDYRPGGYREIEAHGTPAIRLGGQDGPSYRVFGLERDGRVLGQVVTTVDDRDQITRVVGYQWQDGQTPPRLS